MKIVILPGLDGTGLLTPKLRHSLERGHSVTSLAYPTHLCRYEAVLEWTKSQLPKEDHVLVAESFSGPVAVCIGAEKPPGLKGIVFVATFAKSPRKLPVPLAYLIEIMPFRSAFMINVAQPITMGKWANSAFTKQFRQALKIVPPETLSKRLISVLQVDVVAVLKGIEVPVVYLRATKDRLLPARMALEFASPYGRVQDIEGPHFLLQACTDQCDLRIAHFATDLEKRN
ncbi:MAG: alpha/beta hydrolase [Pseudomonadota bacterium]